MQGLDRALEIRDTSLKVCVSLIFLRLSHVTGLSLASRVFSMFCASLVRLVCPADLDDGDLYAYAL